MLGMTDSSSSGLIQTLTLLNTICTEVLVRVGWRWRFDTWPRSKVQHFKTCSPVIPKSWVFCFLCYVIQTLHLLFLTSTLLTRRSLGFFFPLALLGLHSCVDFSSSSEQGLLAITSHGLLAAVASLVAKLRPCVQRLQELQQTGLVLSNCGT